MSKLRLTTALVLSSLSGVAIAANTAGQEVVQEQNFNTDNTGNAGNFSPTDQGFIPTTGAEGGATSFEGDDSPQQNDQGGTFNSGNK